MININIQVLYKISGNDRSGYVLACYSKASKLSYQKRLSPYVFVLTYGCLIIMVFSDRSDLDDS